MKRLRFPIRLKIMVSLLLAITAVVSVISFAMASFFHEDKQSYMKDWISIAAMSTAEECRALLTKYTKDLRTLSAIMLDEELAQDSQERLLQDVFDGFPELVDITIYREGEEVRFANDQRALEAAGLERQGLLAQRQRHPLPLERILGGEVYVANSSVSEELPSFTIAFGRPAQDAAPPAVVAAVVRADELLRLGARFRVFEVSIVGADGTLLAHPDLRRVTGRSLADTRPESAEPGGQNQASVTVQLTRDGVEMLGGYADVDFGGVTTAVHVHKSAAHLASRDLIYRLLWVGSLLLVAAAVAGRFSAQRITRPVEHLSRATRKIGRGDFEIRVDVESRDEIGALAGSFNQMASELKTREEALEEAQAQLVQSEKLAAFGQLGAGIAHEVKNPLAGILGCAQLTLMDLSDVETVRTNVELIEKETDRCKKIIDNLLKFARQGKSILGPTPINDVVRDSVAIVNHQLELQNVKLRTALDDGLPLVRGNANQLQQVLMNLMMNAQQAMEGEQGTVTVRTRRQDDRTIVVEVQDNGPGMTPEVRDRLFEPFFTTKPTGKGTGLGLSVSYGIIKDHAGEIAVDSEPGEGATFIISLPALPEGEGQPATVTS